MSRKNLELAQRVYPASIDLAAVFAEPEALAAFLTGLERLFQPEFETVVDPDFEMLAGDPGDRSRQTPYYGREGFAAAFEAWLSEWESWMVTPVDFIAVDQNRVVVELDITGRSKSQQIEIASRSANVLTFADARVTRIELFLRHDSALRAVGLSA